MMFKWLITLVLLVSFGFSFTPAFAEDPTVLSTPTPNKVEGLELPIDFTINYDEGYIKIEAKTIGDQVDWIVLSDVKVKFEKQGDKAVIIGLPKVETTIVVFAVSNPNGKLVHARTNISVKGSQAAQPPPRLIEPPQPVLSPAAKLFIIFIVDLDKVTPEQAQLLNSASFRKNLVDNGHTLKIISSKSTQVKEKKLDGFVNNAGGPPVLIIEKTDGTVKYAKVMPKTEEEALVEIKKIAEEK